VSIAYGYSDRESSITTTISIHSPSECYEDSIYISFGTCLIIGEDMNDIILIYELSSIPYALFTVSANLTVSSLSIKYNSLHSEIDRSLFLNQGGFILNISDVIILSSTPSAYIYSAILCFLSGVNNLTNINAEYFVISNSSFIEGKDESNIFINNCNFSNIKRIIGNGAVINHQVGEKVLFDKKF
jgi:hypothetical protein